jgi:hypothetical protein
MKSVNLDEVFVKLKEISNPGHPHDSCKCGCRESGGSDRKKSLRRRPQKKKFLLLMAELVNCAACLIHSSILCPKCPKVVDHEEDNWCSDHRPRGG